MKNLSYYSPGKIYSNLAFCSKEIDNFYTNILTGCKTISKQIILHDGKQITPLSVPLSVPLGGSVCTMGCPLIVYLQSYQCVKKITVHKFSHIIIAGFEDLNLKFLCEADIENNNAFGC